MHLFTFFSNAYLDNSPALSVPDSLEDALLYGHACENMTDGDDKKNVKIAAIPWIKPPERIYRFEFFRNYLLNTRKNLDFHNQVLFVSFLQTQTGGISLKVQERYFQEYPAYASPQNGSSSAA